MVRKNAARSHRGLKLPTYHGNGHKVHNKILLGLPDEESTEIFSKLEFVSLPVRTVLNEAGLPIKDVFFMNDGLASILTTLAEGKSVEVGLCGKEGFVGLPLVVGFTSSPTRASRGQRFQNESERFYCRFAGLSKSCSCPATFCIGDGFAIIPRRRLARWLLMSQDRLGGDFVPLTQDFLAHMLGTRRASVSVAAGMLQKAGLISHVRGNLKIENPEQIKKWRAEVT